MRLILKYILRILAKRTLQRYHPIVIGITGSVGKTTAKEAIYAVLNKKFFVWKNAENFNNEIGVPLAILGITPSSRRGNPVIRQGKIRLLGQIIQAAWYGYIARRKWYPSHLVLELAADHPGDIGYLVEMTRPQVGVITAIGEVPVHVENYEKPKDVAKEKFQLIAGLPADGLAVLNADDGIVMRMKDRIKSNSVTFGFAHEADYRASNLSFFIDDQKVSGISFRVNKGDTFLPLRVCGTIAAHQIYAVLAAAALGMHFGMNLVEIAAAADDIEFPKSRTMPLRGINGSTVIDDTYNASPLSMRAALDTLRQFPGKRKIALLGRMAELGKYEDQEHKIVEEYAKKCADIVVWYMSPDKTLPDIRDMIQEGDIILVKGSRIMRMERIVDAIREKP